MIAVAFMMLLLKPFSDVLNSIYERIHYLKINDKLFVPITSCKLIAATIPETNHQDNNLTINNHDYFEWTDIGCYVYVNTIRLSFALD